MMTPVQADRSRRMRPVEAASAALDAALISGGDARLALDPADGLNPSGCQPFPRPDEISLSSSTASTISPGGYAEAQAAFARLAAAQARGDVAMAFARMADDVRDAIRARLDLPDAEVVLSPSGTDGTLQALFLARGLLGRAVTSIVVGADESGSGVPAAAGGRHFAATTSSGRAVAKGAPIAGLACAVVTIAARDAQGQARPLAEIDAEVAAAAAGALHAGNAVVLHAMDYSKLGSRGPSLACLREIRATDPGSVQVVVDACQARLGRAQLRWYLDQGFLVLVTGSKFFAGPPLSGALLVPESLWAAAARIGEVPAGLADYAARDDWPSRFGRIRDGLPVRQNVGQLLRWIAALAEMRAYFAVPALFRQVALAEFAAAVTRQLADYPECVLLPDAAPLFGDGEFERDEFAARTIFGFTVTHAGRPLSLGKARALHRALNLDVGTLGLGPAPAGTSALCHIGQPVAIADGAGGSTGALRISADARLVSQSWSHTGVGDLVSTARLTRRIGQVAVVLDKLRFLAARLDRLPDGCVA
jgi:hypothetical protein